MSKQQLQQKLDQLKRLKANKKLEDKVNQEISNLIDLIDSGILD